MRPRRPSPNVDSETLVPFGQKDMYKESVPAAVSSPGCGANELKNEA